MSAKVSTPTTKTVTVTEAMKVALVCRLYLCKLCREGTLSAKKDDRGSWQISESSLTAWITKRETREARRIENLKSNTGGSTRPSIASCERIARKVEEDTTLTVEQQDLFLSRIDAYREEYDLAYTEMILKRESK
jgi:hypothetical protein